MVQDAGNKMTNVLNKILPTDLVDVVKLYTGEAEWRNGKYVHITRIPKTDYRYTMLKKRPRIKQVLNNIVDYPLKGSVWFKTSVGKFIVINVLYTYVWTGTTHTPGYFWEMHYNQELIQMYV